MKSKTEENKPDAKTSGKTLLCKSLVKTGLECTAGTCYEGAEFHLPEAEAKKLEASKKISLL